MSEKFASARDTAPECMKALLDALSLIPPESSSNGLWCCWTSKDVSAGEETVENGLSLEQLASMCSTHPVTALAHAGMVDVLVSVLSDDVSSPSKKAGLQILRALSLYDPFCSFVVANTHLVIKTLASLACNQVLPVDINIAAVHVLAAIAVTQPSSLRNSTELLSCWQRWCGNDPQGVNDGSTLMLTCLHRLAENRCLPHTFDTHVLKLSVSLLHHDLSTMSSVCITCVDLCISILALQNCVKDEELERSVLQVGLSCSSLLLCKSCIRYFLAKCPLDQKDTKNVVNLLLRAWEILDAALREDSVTKLRESQVLSLVWGLYACIVWSCKICLSGA